MVGRVVLTGTQARQRLAPVLEELGKTNRECLAALLPLLVGGKARLGDCLKAAFPNKNRADAHKQFHLLCKAVNEAAGAAGVNLSLEVDAGTQDGECWLAGADETEEALRAFAEAGTADVGRLASRNELVRARAVVRDAESLKADRRTVRFFVSYAHKDGATQRKLLDQLTTLFGASKRYRYETWTDEGLLLGEAWDARIRKEIARCDFGLLFVSPAFLTRDYIKDNELPALMRLSKPVIPVALGSLSPRLDWLGLEDAQVFFLDADKRAFEKCSSSLLKKRFVEELFEGIEKRLDACTDAASDDDARGNQVDADLERAIHDMARHAAEDHPSKTFIPTRAASYGLRDLERIELAANQPAERGIDALEFLTTWVHDPTAPPFCAVLGEYGVGKTTTLKRWTRDLAEAHVADRASPQVIFVDLKSVELSRAPNELPDLRKILAAAIRHTWRQSGEPALTPDAVIDAVQKKGAVIVFDGLDEQIVHLSAARSRAFIRELWRILPPMEAHARGAERAGKLVLSCRSHYFKDVWSQNAMLTGEDREGIRAADYRVLLMLPFDEAQIRAYLVGVLGEEAKADAALALFGSVHNLRELAARPYLLSVMTDHLDELERRRARGETVLGVTLYEILIGRWMARDEGKHQLTPADKLELMESIAADMHADSAREWAWSRVEAWLKIAVHARPELTSRYRDKAPEVLDEDFRTATFVLRPDDSREHFRFAHSSLQEYFHARRLVRALNQGDLDAWAIDMPSLETLDFVGQMLAVAGAATGGARRSDAAKAIESLNALLSRGEARGARVALRYWLLAIDRGYPEASPARARLDVVDLESWQIAGRNAEQPLVLAGASLAGACLDRAIFRDVNLAGVDLAGASLRLARFERVTLAGVQARNAIFTGAVLRECAGSDLKAAEATWYDADWIASDLTGADVGSEFSRAGTAIACRGTVGGAYNVSPTVLHDTALVCLPEGHTGAVRACAWSPSGRRIVSGSHDNTLRVWDAESGRCMLAMQGHTSAVETCGWSPNGRYIVSGSRDMTVRIWDADSGRCLRVLEGHTKAVWACAWSPDGGRLVSGSDDGTLRIWDAESGQCLFSLEGHIGTVLTCEWSPDRRRVVSGANDGTLRIWDAESGRHLLTLQGHTDAVTASAWSIDGQRLVSASYDETLRIWDADSGRTLLTLGGHTEWVRACAWSPDGRRLASGSDDNTVRIWDAESGRCLLIIEAHTDSVMACAWSPDGRRLASGSDDYALRIWDAESGRGLLALEGRPNSVMACAWSPDGRRLASGADDNTLRIWNAETGRSVLTLEGHVNRVLACAWSPDGRRLVSGSDDGTLRIWDAQAGCSVLTLKGHTNSVWSCAWSPDGRRLVSGADDNTLRIWDAETGYSVLILKGHANSVWACAWSPDERRLVSGSYDKTIRIWDAESGRCLASMVGHTRAIRTCAWSPDARRLVSGGWDNVLRIWDAEAQSCVLTLEGHADAVMACAWSPDGRRLVSGAYDNKLYIWDTESGRALLSLEGHMGAVRACAWSSDGRRVASGSYDNTLRVWDAESGRALSILIHLSAGEAATLDGDARRIRWASPGAWRHLGWRAYDERAGRIRIFPAETFGPLPG